MIVVVAPYSPPSRQASAHLGASRKLETIISILAKLNVPIVLVNSAHNETKIATVDVGVVNISGVTVIEITPPIYSKRAIGKLRNLFDVNCVLDAIKQCGEPEFIWFYNGYAFEMRLAKKARALFKVPMILEFEDWHFSRGRGINPKPYIDFLLWRLAVKSMAGAFVVNERLADKLLGRVEHVQLLPGIVPQVLADMANQYEPFSNAGSRTHIGFFGGLSVEKGADIVLKLAQSLPDDYVVHVTGSGVLAADFEHATQMLAGKLCYYGKVDDVTLYRLIAQCDVLLNPHVSIVAMDNGVFPFKVIEAVASGRLLISTGVPSNGLDDVLAGVCFIEHDVEAFRAAILSSREFYDHHEQLIKLGAKLAAERFGERALLSSINQMTQIKTAI